MDRRVNRLQHKILSAITTIAILWLSAASPLNSQVLKPKSPKPVPQAGLGNVQINSAAELKPDERMVALQGGVGRFILADCMTQNEFAGMWLLDSLGDTIQHVSTRPGSPSWASDNLRAVCIDPRLRLKVLALHEPGKSLIIQTPNHIRPEFPAWAPGLELIAFQSPDSSGVRQIFFIEPTSDGQGLQQVTSGATGCYYPSWSPDGHRLLFSSVDPESGVPSIESIDSSGLDRRVIYPADSLQLVCPVYSPDGKYIVAASKTAGDLFRMDADGTNLVNLTHIGDREQPFANPRFTDDGVWVICTHRLVEPNTIEIYQVLASGGATKRLTDLADPLPFIYAAPNR